MENRASKRRTCRNIDVQFEGIRCRGVDISSVGISLLIDPKLVPDIPIFNIELSAFQSGGFQKQVFQAEMCGKAEDVGPQKRFKFIDPAAVEAFLVDEFSRQDTLNPDEQAELQSLREELHLHVSHAHSISLKTISFAVTFLGAFFGFSDRIQPYLLPLLLLFPFAILVLGAQLFNTVGVRIRRISTYISYYFESRIPGVNWERSIYNVRKVTRGIKHNVVDIYFVSWVLSVITVFGVLGIFLFTDFSNQPMSSSSSSNGSLIKLYCGLAMLILSTLWYWRYLPRIKRHTQLLSGASVFEEEQYAYWRQIDLHGGEECKQSLQHIHDSFDLLFWRDRPLAKNIKNIRNIAVNQKCLALGDACPLKYKAKQLYAYLRDVQSNSCGSYTRGSRVFWMSIVFLGFLVWPHYLFRENFYGINGGRFILPEQFSHLIAMFLDKVSVWSKHYFYLESMPVNVAEDQIKQGVMGVIVWLFLICIVLIFRLCPYFQKSLVKWRNQYLWIAMLVFGVIWGYGSVKFSGLAKDPIDQYLLLWVSYVAPLWLLIPVRAMRLPVHVGHKDYIFEGEGFKSFTQKWKHTSYLMKEFPPVHLQARKSLPLGTWFFYYFWFRLWKPEPWNVGFQESKSSPPKIYSGILP